MSQDYGDQNYSRSVTHLEPKPPHNSMLPEDSWHRHCTAFGGPVMPDEE
jgi:hypothetical protein